VDSMLTNYLNRCRYSRCGGTTSQNTDILLFGVYLWCAVIALKH
jgi:hypothetical protein